MATQEEFDAAYQVLNAEKKRLTALLRAASYSDGCVSVIFSEWDHGPFIVYPHGHTGRESEFCATIAEVEAYIAALPSLADAEAREWLTKQARTLSPEQLARVTAALADEAA